MHLRREPDAYIEQTPYGEVVINPSKFTIHHDFTDESDGSHDEDGMFRLKEPLVSREQVEAISAMYLRATPRARRVLVCGVTIGLCKLANVKEPPNHRQMIDAEGEDADAMDLMFNTPVFMMTTVFHMLIGAVAAGSIPFEKPKQ